MLYSFRFYLSWIVAAVLMYLAFYFWHGIFLNDLNRLSFPKALFLALAALVYLVVSFVVYRTYESKILKTHIFSPIFRGIVSGFLVGFILFSVVTVLGISFSKNINVTYIIADCAWQIAEQVVGGIVIGLGKMFIIEPIPEPVQRY
jgi:hypothetical protein